MATTTKEHRRGPTWRPVPSPGTVQPARRPTGAAPIAEVDVTWAWLYRVGGIAAALLAALTVAHAVVFAVAGLPSTVETWFALFQHNDLLGLLAFELLMVLYVVLSIPVVLALWATLRRTTLSLMAVYLALSLVGTALFITARPAFEMLFLSHGYAAATTDVQRAMYLAAGEALLAVFHGTAFWVSYVLGAITGLLVAAAMLRTTVFSKATAYLRIASSLLDLGLFVPAVGLVISLGSVVCLLVFNLLVARRLWQLGRVTPPASPGSGREEQRNGESR